MATIAQLSPFVFILRCKDTIIFRNFATKFKFLYHLIEKHLVLEDIDPDEYDSLQYFHRVLIQSGIIDALKKNGIQEGDTVSIYDIEFEYVR